MAESDHEPAAPFVRSFARGLDVLLCFAGHRSLSSRDVAQATGLDRTTARRLLSTLHELGFVEARGNEWALTARTLTLGYAALTERPFPDLALPYLRDAARETEHSCSLGALDGSSAVFLARAVTRKVMTISLYPGVRVPAHASAMGRALLSGMDDRAVAEMLERDAPDRYTDRTTTGVADVVAAVARARADGWSMVDQELETGVRSVAAPVRDRGGAVVAAVSIGTNAGVVDVERLRGPILDAVRRCAGRIEADLATQPVPLPGLDVGTRQLTAE